MTLEHLTGLGVPNGIATDIVDITPNDTEDNVPSNAIAFTIRFVGSSTEVDGTVDVITAKGSEKTWGFHDKHVNYIALRRIKSTNFPPNAVAQALTV